MKHSFLKFGIAFGMTSLAGCSTLSSTSIKPIEASSQMTVFENDKGSTGPKKLDLSTLRHVYKQANAEIQAAFPIGQDDSITLWAADLENLVDGTFTQTFGDKLSPAPSLKLHSIFKNSGVMIVDHQHVPLCQGAEIGKGQYWVLRTYVSNLDENVNRTVKGFYPSGDSGDFQAEIDRGHRNMTDSFKLSAKLTECRSGRIIHSAENDFSKTTSSKDNSVYLFGKHLGLFYKSTRYEDPGLNRTKDMALDVFLSSIAMEMVGVAITDPQDMTDLKLAELNSTVLKP